MSKKDIFIIGSKGIPAKYGGFETFVENLTAKKKSEEIQYHVACMGKDTIEYKYNEARCFNIKVPNIGSAKAIYYDLVALKKCIQYVKEQHIENAIIYILACRIGPFISHYKRKLNKLGCKLYVNPDGHEWKRAKWNWMIKKYWKFSEKLMVKHADLLICDSINIEKYIREDYKKYHPNTTFIAYGSDVQKSILKDDDSKLMNWYKGKNIKAKEYYLVVGRFVPENNYETMIKEYMKSKTKKDFVLITNVEQNKFYEALKEKTNFDQDKRIKFVGTVYDQELLKKIRENAYGYIHGHEVGGTNPSLLEALATTDLNLLLDVGFNKEVAQDGALYWNKENDNLSSLLNKLDNISKHDIENYSKIAKKRIKEEYSWDKIIKQYENTFCKKKILLISNMYPSEKYPHYGVFVKNTENILKENNFDVQRSIMYKKDTKVQKLCAYVSFYFKTIHLARKKCYDVIYGHYISHIALPILLIHKMRPNIKIVINVHGNDIVPEEKKDEKYLKLSKKALDISDIIVSPSEYFKNILIQDYKMQKEKIQIYPSGGVNTDLFFPIDEIEAKKQLGLDLNNIYIGFVSRLELKKGWDILLKAIQKLDDQVDKNVKFLFVGDGTKKTEFFQMIDELKLKKRIIYMSYKSQNELKYVFNAMSIFCFPTYRKSESLGLVGLEAMSCGKIVIASNFGGPKEYIQDEINGFLFKERDPLELANKIKFVINLDNDKKQKIISRAIQSSKMYSQNKIKNRILNIFNTIER